MEFVKVQDRRLLSMIPQLKELIEFNGGKNSGSISGKTSFLLAGDNMGPEKLKKAEKLGVKIISEDDFEKMLDK